MASRDIELSIAGVPIGGEDMAKNEWKGNPLQNNIALNYKEYDDGEVEAADELVAPVQRQQNVQ